MPSSNQYIITQLLGNRIKPTNERFGLWLLTENMDNNNLLSDIGNIDYTKGAARLGKNKLQPITDPFCDNIMLIKVSDIGDCVVSSKNNFIVKKEMCGAYNSFLRAKFTKFISARHGVKAKLPFYLDCDNRVARGAVDIIGKRDMEIIK